ncbi:hypothetical protein BGX28_005686 [Mortierella sp. GBA30]|nr:hypothetical protein BGX28_005686 [Mortierella sp. GBA30]
MPTSSNPHNTNSSNNLNNIHKTDSGLSTSKNRIALSAYDHADADTGSTFASDPGLRGSNASSAIKTEDQEAPTTTQQRQEQQDQEWREGKEEQQGQLALGTPLHLFNSTANPYSSPFGPTLNNKRRSHADLLFVPIKIKEKRNSSASSASSVESSRQEDSAEHAVWTGSNHPKSASGGSASSTSSVPGPTMQPRSTTGALESQASPPVVRKLSVTKGSGKGSGSGSTSSPKTFQCTGYPGCNMVFTRSEHLARHERKHTGEKPYKCIVPNCPRTFSRYDNMIQHTQTHGDRTKRDSLAVVTAAGGASQSRSSSLQSTPLVAGRPRGGSSPVVFGAGYEDPHFHRSLQNSPAGGSYGSSPAFSHQHPYPYSPYYPHQQQQHTTAQWVPLSGPAGSPAMMTGRHANNYGGVESKTHFSGSSSSGSTGPVVRTLKANSRSLPHLQPRSSPSISADSPSMGLQNGMSGMETEELKRRKSEILLPSYSGRSVVTAYGYGYGHGHGHGHGQGIGLGMSSIPSTVSHPQLSQVERLTPQEQERLNEHRRSAAVMQQRRDSQGKMTPPEITEYAHGYFASRQGSMNQPLAHGHPFSAQEKERDLEHRRSTPELYDSSLKAMKRSSNDPNDIVVQPLPSRDTRSGMQWYSQVGTPLPSAVAINPRSSSLAPRDGHPGQHTVSSTVPSGDESSTLPPLMSHYGDPRADRQPRIRSHSSHIHPLSRPSEPSSGGGSGSWPVSRDMEYKERSWRFDPTLSPRLEQALEERYYPIRKREVLDVMERMDPRDFMGLKSQVAESYANEQFRNPEFLGNMTAVLCAIQAPHPSLKRSGQRQQLFGQSAVQRASNGSLKGSDIASRRSSRDMEVEEDIDEREDAMDVDTVSNDDHFAEHHQQQRAVLDIDVDSFRRDPEPDARGLGDLTIKGLEPTASFVAGFELVMETADGSRVTETEEQPPRSVSGYPSNARIGRFYLPKFAYRTRESMMAIKQLQEQQRLNPNGAWVCCQFKEYQGLWIWVLETVLEKYHEISLKHKMALTLVGAKVYHHTPQFVQDEWVTMSRDGSQQQHHHQQREVVEVQEKVLYPEMIQRAWKDMYTHYHQQQPQHQQQQYQYRRSPPQFSPQQSQFPLPLPHLRAQRPSQPIPPSMSNRVATYEEYQKSLIQGGDPRRRESTSYQQQPVIGIPTTTTTTTSHGIYYNDYRQHQQGLHREDLSSAPSSPPSPHQDDFFPEDNQTNESASSTPQHETLSSTTKPTTTMATATHNNMHRRISIAELCNPMQSLATERERDRFPDDPPYPSTTSSSPSSPLANPKRSSM